MPYNIKLNNKLIFTLLWALIFILYLPAAKAGFVMDFTGWLDQVKNHSFSEYINRDNFNVKSLYQLWQLFVYVFYHIFGVNPWAWHILFVTSQASVSLLVYIFFQRLFSDSGIEKAGSIALTGTILYTICPHLSEVIVWEPTYHYFQGMALLLLILICTQAYFHTRDKKYVWFAISFYTLSLFTLEYFYLTPLFVVSLGLYYRHTLKYNKKLFIGILLYFIVPFIILLIARTVLFKVLYHDWISRIGTGTLAQSFYDYLVKPPKYFFHIVLLGRYFPFGIRQKVYAFCATTKGLIIFYSLFLLICTYLILRFKQLSGKARVSAFIVLYIVLATVLVLPMWFPELQLVTCDRYTYMLCAFIYMLIAVLISYIPYKLISIASLALFALINVRYTVQVNRYWMKSARINNNLLKTFPGTDNKITILLDQPENMHGVPMIQATSGGEFKLMYNLLMPGKITGDVLDAASFNMETPEDGAHIMVVSDSILHVTLNQWGTWWWYDGFGAVDRENEFYKIHFYDGHWYDLKLKKPAAGYRLLFQTGGQWKIVDWDKKNVDQY